MFDIAYEICATRILLFELVVSVQQGKSLRLILPRQDVKVFYAKFTQWSEPVLPRQWGSEHRSLGDLGESRLAALYTLPRLSFKQ